MMNAEITRIAAKSDGKLTFGFLLGLGIALWSANAGMKAMFDALNIIYDEDEKRGFIWLNVVSLFFTVCAIAEVGLAIALVVVFPLLLAAFGLTSFDHPIIGYSLARDVRANHPWARRALPLRTEPVADEVALDQRRQRLRRARLACGLLAVFLVPRQFRQLQRHLRGARRRGRLDDVDVVFDHRGVGRGRA